MLEDTGSGRDQKGGQSMVVKEKGLLKAMEPVFEPDAVMLSGIGDGIGKINQAVPGYFGKGNLRDMTGVEPEE